MVKQHKLKKLLDESYEKYYWLGFLLADGHFEEKRLSVSLSSKDFKHLQKFKEYLGIPLNIGTSFSKIKDKKYEYCKISVMDSSTIPLLKQRYCISNTKTYDPPTILNISEDFLFCLFIGFIDGDGCIQKQTGRVDSKITIKCHSSWKPFLKLFNEDVKETKDGYSYIHFTKTSTVRSFKEKAILFNLPILERKWDIIDLNYFSKYEVSNAWQSQAFLLYKQNFTVKEISLTLSKQYITVYNALRRGGYFD